MKEKYKIALNEIIKDLKSIPEVTGALFFGSVQRGEEKDNSDIDLYVIVSGNECWNFKKSYSDVIAEIYFCPAREWKRNMENGHVITLRAFSSGVVLFETGNEVSELIQLGKELWERGPKPLTQLQVGNWRIRLTEYIQDIEGLPAESYQSKLLCGMAVPLALEAFCSLNQIWPEKPERLVDYIDKYDAKLHQMAVAFYEAKECDSRLAIEIIDYVIRPFGGRFIEYEGPRVVCK